MLVQYYFTAILSQDKIPRRSHLQRLCNITLLFACQLTRRCQRPSVSVTDPWESVKKVWFESKSDLQLRALIAWSQSARKWNRLVIFNGWTRKKVHYNLKHLRPTYWDQTQIQIVTKCYVVLSVMVHGWLQVCMWAILKPFVFRLHSAPNYFFF